MLNRKAHVGTIMLLFVAFFLVGSALYSMISFKNNFNSEVNSLKKISIDTAYTKALIMSTARSIVHRSIFMAKDASDFEASLRNSITELAETKRKDPALGDSMLKLKNYYLTKDATQYKIKLEDVSYKVIDGATEVKQTFSFEITFNSEGIIEIR